MRADKNRAPELSRQRVHQITNVKAAPAGIAAPPAPECQNAPLSGEMSALFSVPPAVGQVTL
jgi:hypothetical protein